MLSVINREWQIAKTYIEDALSLSGPINLDWDDFKEFAEKHRPVLAVRNEGDTAVKELTEETMAEMRKRCSNNLSNIILLISYKEGENLMMDEMEAVSNCLATFANENIEIKWGISQNSSLNCKRCIAIFAFE